MRRTTAVNLRDVQELLQGPIRRDADAPGTSKCSERLVLAVNCQRVPVWVHSDEVRLTPSVTATFNTSRDNEGKPAGSLCSLTKFRFTFRDTFMKLELSCVHKLFISNPGRAVRSRVHW